ncbi:hypothetical protein CsatA_012392 [Cannabis sativa]
MAAPRSSSTLGAIPEDSTKSMAGPRSSPRLRTIPEDSTKSMAGPRSSPRLRTIPEDSTKSMARPRSSPRLQTIPEDSTKSMAGPRSSPRLRNISEDSTKSMASPRSSPRLRTIPEDYTKSMAGPRRSPRLRTIPEDYTKSMAGPRRSPRLRTIPEDSTKSMAGQTSIPRLRNISEDSTKSMASPRSSPRLRNISEDSTKSMASPRSSPRLRHISEDSTKSMASPRSSPRLRHISEDSAKSMASPRSSPRLQTIPEDKRPYYGSHTRKRTPPNADDTTPISKMPKLNKCKSVKAKNSHYDSDHSNQNGVILDDGQSLVQPATSLKDETNDAHFAARVKESLRLFNLLHLQFVQEEETRCKKEQNDGEPQGNVRRRPDLKVISEMFKKRTLKPERTFGHIPGIEVGRQFFSRSEMVVVGLHGHWLRGIDYMGDSNGQDKFKNYIFPLALAIVLSGQYEDDVDESEEVVYTGEGGNDLLGKKRQIKDQELKHGNLALKNNMEQSIPVRVVRGHKCQASYSNKVVQFWAEKGTAGFTVYKYRLKRFSNQPELITNQVHFIGGRDHKAQSVIPGLVCKDISNGQESKPIPVTNVIDDPPSAPEGFTYIKSIQVADNIKVPSNGPGCNCKEKCTNPKTCSCARLNNNDFPYVSQDGGRLVEPMDVVFECGPQCQCGPKCVNRTSMRELKHRLEVYRTPKKGWAVRSWDYILPGSPVCEYVGVIRRSDELDNVSENDYIFEIDGWQTINEMEGRERRLRDVSLPQNHTVRRKGKISECAPEFSIDAGSFGNVARFINHSCEPNLFVQCVLNSHHDLRLARVVLFAADSIPPMQELTYDYGYILDSVVGPNGKIKKSPCYCGEPDCRKRLY